MKSMEKVLILDTDTLWTSDIDSWLMINPSTEYEFVTDNQVDHVAAEVERERPDRLVVAASILPSYDSWDYGIPVACYARRSAELEQASKAGVDCYGVVRNAAGLIRAIEDGSIVTISNPNPKKAVPEASRSVQADARPAQETSQLDTARSKNRSGGTAGRKADTSDRPKPARPQERTDTRTLERKTESHRPAAPVSRYVDDEEENRRDLRRPVRSRAAYTDDPDDEPDRRPARPERPVRPERTRPSRYADEPDETDDPDEREARTERGEERRPTRRPEERRSAAPNRNNPGRRIAAQENRPARSACYAEGEEADDQYDRAGDTRHRPESRHDEERYEGRYADAYDDEAEPDDAAAYDDGPADSYQDDEGYGSDYDEPDDRPEVRNGRADKARFGREDRKKQTRLKAEVDRDTGLMAGRAKVITVYSAKGGVGKTTIACELATFLSLTSHGRSTFKVCIVDYNIDYGDVMHTLGYDDHKVTMTTWAMDIKDRIRAGEDPASIHYSEDEIAAYLQRSPESGLYALLAPLSNQDSMEIGEDELRVMLRNVVYHGGFDFVVCDTGNNTRDSSMEAVEQADDVLLVLTQNFNTANGNDTFLGMMDETEADMSKFHLVINQARPGRNVGIPVEDLEEAFENPSTGRKYDCYCVIRDSDDVRAASNLQRPLVFQSSNEFTKHIGMIASIEIGDRFVLEAPKKKGLFARFFGR